MVRIGGALHPKLYVRRAPLEVEHIGTHDLDCWLALGCMERTRPLLDVMQDHGRTSVEVMK